MKKNIQIIIFFSLLTLGVISITGCKKMDDSYKQFIENGETIYIAKADSIKINGGKNRAEVSWLLLSDPKVTKYKVLWNNGRDSITGDVTKTKDVDLVKKMLTNIEEGTYFFDIYLFDKYGNSSIKSTKSGKVYGSRYEASLLVRAYRKINRVGNHIQIQWMAADESVLRVELEYHNTNGDLVKVEIKDHEEVTTTLQDIAVKGDFKYRTVFNPELNGLDVFYTPYSTITLNL